LNLATDSGKDSVPFLTVPTRHPNKSDFTLPFSPISRHQHVSKPVSRVAIPKKKLDCHRHVYTLDTGLKRDLLWLCGEMPIDEFFMRTASVSVYEKGLIQL
jgi:hypothetical protein